MRGRHALEREYARPLKACAIVLALLCIVPGVEAVLDAVGPNDARVLDAEGFDVSGIAESRNPFVALDKLEEALEPNGAVPSRSYMDEVGVLPGASDVRVDASGTVVGYTVEGVEGSVFAELSAQMGERGWTEIPLGEVTGATFVREGGGGFWVVATCTQVGEKTSVVTRCITAS